MANSSKTMKTQYRKRQMRAYQEKSRGGQSTVTRLENLQVLLRYERSDITEGRACEVLEMDRLSFRAFREEAIAAARVTAFMDLDIYGTFDTITMP